MTDSGPAGNTSVAVADFQRAADVDASTAVDEGAHVDQPGRFHYRPALDGLRAVAVIGVLLYHGTQLTTSPFWVAPGGFLGVDFFFVLSGYLITTLLLVEWGSKGTIDLKHFYIRRAKRLLPALAMVLGLVSLFFLFRDAVHLSGSQTARFRGDALSSVFYVANWRFAFSGQSYFDQLGGPSPLRHLWSLAIEEQFYLIWPAVLVVLLRVVRVSRRTLGIILAGATFASFVVMWWLYAIGTDVSRVYYGTDTRAQAMLLGALLAVVLMKVKPAQLADRRVQIIGFLGLAGALVMFGQVLDDDGWMYYGGFLLMAVLAAMAITASVAPSGTPFTRVLGVKPLVWVGTLSYGIYLWHWPIYTVLTSEFTGLGGLPLLALRLLFTLAVASVSYYFVEAPIRFGRMRSLLPQKVVFAGGAATILLIVVSLVVVAADPDDITALNQTELQEQIDDQRIPVFPGDVKVALFGDSVAQTLHFYRGEHAKGLAVYPGTIVGCGIVRGNLVSVNKPEMPRTPCDDWPAEWQKDINTFQPDVSVVLVGAWEVFDHRVDGQVLSVFTDEYADFIKSELETGHRILTAGGRPMVLLTTPCMKTLQPGTQSDYPERNDPRRVDWLNGVLNDWAAQHDDVKVIDLHGFQCPTGQYQEELDGVKLSPDGAHYTKPSAALVWQWLRPQLLTYGREPAPTAVNPPG